MHDWQRDYSAIESAGNPYQAPSSLEPAADAAQRTITLTVLARWLIGGFAFEFVLACITLTPTPNGWPTVFLIPAISFACLVINVIILGAAGWRIGRWHKMLPAVFLSQIIHLTCWLIYIMCLYVLTGWNLTSSDGDLLMMFVGGSAILNVWTSGLGSYFGITKMGFLVRPN